MCQLAILQQDEVWEAFFGPQSRNGSNFTLDHWCWQVFEESTFQFGVIFPLKPPFYGGFTSGFCVMFDNALQGTSWPHKSSRAPRWSCPPEPISLYLRFPRLNLDALQRWSNVGVGILWAKWESEVGSCFAFLGKSSGPIRFKGPS